MENKTRPDLFKYLFGENELKLNDETKLEELGLTKHEWNNRTYFLFLGTPKMFLELPRSA